MRADNELVAGEVHENGWCRCRPALGALAPARFLVDLVQPRADAGLAGTRDVTHGPEPVRPGMSAPTPHSCAVGRVGLERQTGHDAADDPAAHGSGLESPQHVLLGDWPGYGQSENPNACGVGAGTCGVAALECCATAQLSHALSGALHQLSILRSRADCLLRRPQRFFDGLDEFRRSGFDARAERLMMRPSRPIRNLLKFQLIFAAELRVGFLGGEELVERRQVITL